MPWSGKEVPIKGISEHKVRGVRGPVMRTSRDERCDSPISENVLLISLMAF